MSNTCKVLGTMLPIMLFSLKEPFMFLLMKIQSSEAISLGHRFKATQDLRDLENSCLLLGRKVSLSPLQRINVAKEVK